MMKRSLLRLAGIGLVLTTGVSQADVWVFEPSAGIDQRFDDNYTIEVREIDDDFNPTAVSATRVVGSLELSRESQTSSISGLARLDGLLALSSDGDEGDGVDTNSNGILFLDTKRNLARSSFGLGLNLKFDTPNRDISADITDTSATAADTGADVTQSNDVARARLILSPNYTYDLSRRASVETKLTYTAVRHELPSAGDSIRDRQDELDKLPPDPDTGEPQILSPEAVFTVADELDDFDEAVIDVSYRYKLSPISTFSMFASYGQFITKTEVSNLVNVPFSDKIPDDEQSRILRNPKRNGITRTAKFRLGWDRALSPTVNIDVQLGVYSSDIDNSDLLRDNDPIFEFVSSQELAVERASHFTSDQGYLGSITFRRSAGISLYTAKLSFDVLPSSIGSQVESLEAVATYDRELGPLLDFSFRARAFEPDATEAKADDKFSRRFISYEPKLVWRFSRAWTAAVSYRYRRQKNRINPYTGQSNAVLFSLKYTPPSEIRDLNKRK